MTGGIWVRMGGWLVFVRLKEWQSQSIRGTISQKLYYVNTYLFTKLWYTSQVFKLEEKVINKILAKALDFYIQWRK